MSVATTEVKGLERRIVTPEGIPLRVELARAGDRAGAFLFDFFIQLFLTLALLLLAGSAAGWSRSWSWAFGLLVSFLVRTFYFIWFEIRWQGRTPGKRSIGTRVMDASGGPLHSDAVVVRNLMRELEVWIPLAFLLAPQQVWPDAPGFARLAFSAWALVFAFMPLFNRNRLRAGDMVAGTIVVVAPKAVLLDDLGAVRERRPAGSYEFTDAQLDVYGIYELQVLEKVLRRRDEGRKEALAAVSRQIRKKIDWPGGRVRPERFLRDFYSALRDRLEKKMLLGKKKEDKHSSA